MIQRFSSRRQKIDSTFLNKRLQGAKSYDRIAGYFSSSIIEVAGEAIESIEGQIRIICNSDLDILDVETAKAANLALGREWRSNSEDKLSPQAKARLGKLYDYLASKKIQIRVLPNKVHGLLHGKAGVITQADGSKVCFLGSINETKSAWQLNYEILWEDTSAEGIHWVQEEFESLWNHPKAQPLANAVIEDIKRLSQREVITVTKWKEEENPASPVVESPVYQKQYGLWAHQKYFVKLAFDEHKSGRGARFVLADQVGLGKTLQLALSSMLMALHGDKPILVIAPKTLIWQWQEENMKLLSFPSAVWDGKAWVDENGIKHVNNDPIKALSKCPRRMGIISQGLITRNNEVRDKLLSMSFECVIVDECHRARRKNLKVGSENDKPEPNNLMSFLRQISSCTKSMLLATATPVQLYPIEAYDLLDILAQGGDHVFGDRWSNWKRENKTYILALIQGLEEPPQSFLERWDWMRNPFPAAHENEMVFGTIRNALELSATDSVLGPDVHTKLQPWDRSRLENLDDFFQKHNPFIRHIIRRTRKFLEEKIDEETGLPYLQKVEVELHGDKDHESIILPGYLNDAYGTAEEFCKALGEIMRSAGFMRTLLLRRLGSSIEAGKQTAMKMMGEKFEEVMEEEDEDLGEEEKNTEVYARQDSSGIATRISKHEKDILARLIYQLEQHQDNDPKYQRLEELLFSENWADKGCIIFSQYYVTVSYFSEKLSNQKSEQKIGVYAGSKSGYWLSGTFHRTSKEEIKSSVQKGEIKILFGTDSASEGLNLQRLGTLINLDLPWNPTRLEQRKGRIQRIGQVHEVVHVYNMRYKGSVEDRVHELLSERLQHIFNIFGQIPDILEDVWVDLALGEKEKAYERINAIPPKNPFEIKYEDKIPNIDFESCSRVLNQEEVSEVLRGGW